MTTRNLKINSETAGERLSGALTSCGHVPASKATSHAIGRLQPHTSPRWWEKTLHFTGFIGALTHFWQHQDKEMHGLTSDLLWDLYLSLVWLSAPVYSLHAPRLDQIHYSAIYIYEHWLVVTLKQPSGNIFQSFCIRRDNRSTKLNFVFTIKHHTTDLHKLTCTMTNLYFYESFHS